VTFIDTDILKISPTVSGILFDAPKKCEEKLLSIAKNLYHKQKNQYTFIYSVTNDKVTVSCDSLSEPQKIPINGIGMITINGTNCRLKTKNSKVISTNSLINMTYGGLILQSNVKSLIINNLTTKENIEYGDIQKLIETKFTKRHELENDQKYIKYIIRCIGILIVLILKVIYFIYRRRKATKNSDIPTEPNNSSP